MKPYLEDPDLTLYQGDALEVLRTLPDSSVQMCVTSPPFYGLRDYGTGTWEGGNPDCDHRGTNPARDFNGSFGGRGDLQTRGERGSTQTFAKPFRSVCGKCGAFRVDQQIGLEETPEEWAEKLVAVFREVRRVLRSDGTCWVEVGDSYASGEVGRHDSRTDRQFGARMEGPRQQQRQRTGTKPKDLIGAPWKLAFALRADGWFLRSDIVWSRPNPMPESVTDRPTKSHSYVFLLSKSARYFFDQEAVREPHVPSNHGAPQERARSERGDSKTFGTRAGLHDFKNPAGRNVRSVWQIATQPYPEAHFATYPEELVRRCILAGSSERGCCPECGAPWTRETETEVVTRQATNNGNDLDPHGRGKTREQYAGGYRAAVLTLGWVPSCPCGALSERGFRGNNPVRDSDPAPGLEPRSESVPCTVLDPFFGSGTTGLVARKHGRRTIGIELSPSYCALAARRLQQLSLLSEAGR